jgi:DNA transposition AAA+ family ATPase
MATPTRAFANTKNHQTSKEAIAEETHTSIDEVEKIYEQELTQLASEAKITQYLGVLTTRRVRARLRKH